MKSKSLLLFYPLVFVAVTSFSQNIGIGTNSPAFKLDVQGRMRVKTGTVGSLGTASGIWMEDYRDGTNRFFFGMKDSIRAGFYGSGAGGTGWDFTFNTQNGNIGIGYLDPAFYKLTIDGEMGLYRTTQAGTNLYGSFEYNTGSLLINSKLGNLITSTSPENVILQYVSGFPFSSGNVGIGTAAPVIKLQVEGGTDASGTGGGFLQLGSTASANIGFDNNEIQARNNGVAGNLFLQANGGDLQIGGTNNIIINDGYQVYRNRPLSTNADLLPIAYGKISSAGSPLSGTGNLAVQKIDAGEYQLTLLGESNLYANRHLYTIIATAHSFASLYMINTEIINNNTILVKIARPNVNWVNASGCGCDNQPLVSYIVNGQFYQMSDQDFSILIYKM